MTWAAEQGPDLEFYHTQGINGVGTDSFLVTDTPLCFEIKSRTHTVMMNCNVNMLLNSRCYGCFAEP